MNSKIGPVRNRNFLFNFHEAKNSEFVDKYLDRMDEIDESGNLLLTVLMSIDNRLVTRLLDKGANVNIADAYGNTPLGVACYRRNVPMELIARILELTDQETRVKSKALDNAIKSGRVPLVKMLLDMGLLTGDEEENEPLVHNCIKMNALNESEKKNIIELLLSKSSNPLSVILKLVDGLDLLGHTVARDFGLVFNSLIPHIREDEALVQKVVEKAAKEVRLNIIEYLIKNRLHIGQESGLLIKSLFKAAQVGNEYIVAELLKLKDVSVNIKDYQDSTLIMHAIESCKTGNYSVFNHIMSYRPDLTGKTIAGEDVFDVAIKNNAYGVFEDYVCSMNQSEFQLYKEKRLKNLINNGE